MNIFGVVLQGVDYEVFTKQKKGLKRTRPLPFSLFSSVPVPARAHVLRRRETPGGRTCPLVFASDRGVWYG